MEIHEYFKIRIIHNKKVLETISVQFKGKP